MIAFEGGCYAPFLGDEIMKNLIVPVWNKYTLSIEEAVAYFGIGENKLRNLVNSNKNAPYLLWNGRKAQIKRTLFEKYIDGLEAI